MLTWHHSRWAEVMAFLIEQNSCGYFRWHDSGDLQGQQHLDQIIEVCRLTPDVKHWLPTREIQWSDACPGTGAGSCRPGL